MVAVALPLLLGTLSVLSPVAAFYPLEDVEFAPGFAVLPPPPAKQKPITKPEAREHVFSLRHIFHHGTYAYPHLHRRLDIPSDAQVWMTSEGSDEREPVPKLRARSEPMSIQRMVDRRRATVDSILDTGRQVGRAVTLPASAWEVDEIPGPNVTDKETVLAFAKMASNAYVTDPTGADWEDVNGGYNYTEDFGWETDGLRGHIFADTKNQTVVIGLKGTSPAVFDGPETTHNDKVNDNLFFSCCCGQGGSSRWLQVCDCMTSTYTCNSTCVTKALRNKNKYYWAAQDLYHNVTELYPNAEVWFAGHSLGGAISSLLGLTYGHPALTFEAVPEAMPASRLGLPTPPGYRIGSHQSRVDTGSYHFGHTADPVYMGTCNGWSWCTIGGYAMQSVCHAGHRCVYDTVKDLGWRQGLGYHRIKEVVQMIESYDSVPVCKQDTNCTDCFNWKYYESNGSEITTTMSTTSTTSSRTRTRTETCKTPGWWGCLDETSSTTTTTTTTTSTSTSTCKTPGWFGCKDETTTTSSSSIQTPAPAPTVPTTSSTSATTSCATPGWFGCNDASPSPTSTTSSVKATATPSSSCATPGWFGCNDATPVTSTTTSTSSEKGTKTMTKSEPSTKSCTSRKWFGFVCADPAAEPPATSTTPKSQEEKPEV